MDEALMLNRRALLLGVAPGLGCAHLLAQPGSLTRDLRRVRPLMAAAVQAEIDAELTPGHAAACARAARLEAEFDRLALTGWALPLSAPDSLAMRTEIALAYSPRDRSGGLADIGAQDRCVRASAELLLACARLTGSVL